MVLAVDLALGDGEDVVQEKVAEVGNMMTLPVVDAGGKVLNGERVLSPALCLVDLVGDALGGGATLLEFVKVRVLLWRRCLDEGLDAKEGALARYEPHGQQSQSLIDSNG